ncbi:vesicle-associated protein 2-2-like isoform X1 [Cucurbita pepo subsp. pepo]|uniref:vesicle-associated protein 2-2-like isoform X1 n=1 Tax=Cucurbita pepo subsp. pepo TaxID=3664 RepID=UPI000C9D444B|nr:vesicle-associated protein 2-2-like isoform X1 [Cucurbita pepo subsp. pepo]XP_023528130.1 vesicle-associated protein 2-2-like isoform X1 [Cucurbita pepo subsp. pepo]XP_023528131.1 vesicle-associated protein 2-2-like isoform X1 [Cucurbita pepo subsp. pepo]XP_023528133.1 vesicle-associated protein 2-2-like isoform X1 [Cucurbita pepo subsp. pepo]XP_023528134.1 vesicle-associated protein 2-2-like isoform X1 [Cucurbita pepo subsp. pepo]XP_023528135.1 vesicle-associated protein 2-2-like isoform X
MTMELFEIHPGELKFTFELKKQSSCLIRVINKSEQHIAFKVKTTSPKRYCVRPNTGIIKPKDMRDFTVTMLAQRTAPTDMQCKDKFLVQGTVISPGTPEEDITSDMFARDSGKHIEEKKLKVFLVSPTPTPVLLPINGELKLNSNYENSMPRDGMQTGVENIPPPHKVAKDSNGLNTLEHIDELRSVDTPVVLSPLYKVAEGVEKIDTSKDSDENRAAEDAATIRNEDMVAEPIDNIETTPAEEIKESKPANDLPNLNLTKDFEELKSKLTLMDAELVEAEATIMRLKQERTVTTREREMLKRDLETWRRTGQRSVKVGFPLIYVVMAASISLLIGYFIHP